MPRSAQVRYQLFLPKALADRFERVAGAPGASKSRLLAGAVEAWLERRGTGELEARFARRLDRMSGQLARIDRNGQVNLESLGLFIRYMLTVSASLPVGDEAAQAIGRKRYADFVRLVSQQLAKGGGALEPEEEP